MSSISQDRLFAKWAGTLCLDCRASYKKLRSAVLEPINDVFKPLDKAMQDCQFEYDEEVELYKTYGGD